MENRTTMTVEERRQFIRRYQIRQGYTDLPVERHRTLLVRTLILLFLASVIGYSLGWVDSVATHDQNGPDVLKTRGFGIRIDENPKP